MLGRAAVFQRRLPTAGPALPSPDIIATPPSDFDTGVSALFASLFLSVRDKALFGPA